jgi:DNA repair exonuclease SbcCD ATPase subunit
MEIDLRRKSVPEHERLFDEICKKLKELSHREEMIHASHPMEKIERMQQQLKRSQDELKMADSQIQDKIKSFDDITNTNSDSNSDYEKTSNLLIQERDTNAKLSSDLAKALELNLKLQFELEESRSKSNSIISEEKKYSQFMNDKVKTLQNEMELAQALNDELKSELEKAKQSVISCQADQERKEQFLKSELDRATQLMQEQNQMIDKLQVELKSKEDKLNEVNVEFQEFDKFQVQQTETIQRLSEVAEKKIVELKIELDRKAIECQDYYSHLQKALTQVNLLKQENLNLKDYVTKMNTLIDKRNQSDRASGSNQFNELAQ